MCLGLANGYREQKMSDKDRMIALINEIKADAIKEFADRLKEQSTLNCGCVPWYDIQETIDNLVKEMVGDTE